MAAPCGALAAQNLTSHMGFGRARFRACPESSCKYAIRRVSPFGNSPSNWAARERPATNQFRVNFETSSRHSKGSPFWVGPPHPKIGQTKRKKRKSLLKGQNLGIRLQGSLDFPFESWRRRGRAGRGGRHTARVGGQCGKLTNLVVIFFERTCTDPFWSFPLKGHGSGTPVLPAAVRCPKCKPQKACPRPNQKPKPKNSKTKNSKSKNSKTKNSKTKNSNTKNSKTKNSKTKNSKTKKLKLKNQKLKNQKLKNQQLKNQQFKNPKLKNPKLKNPKLKNRKLKNQKLKNQKPKTQKPKTQKPKTQKPTTQKPTIQKPKTQKPKTQKQPPPLLLSQKAPSKRDSSRRQGLAAQQLPQVQAPHGTPGLQLAQAEVPSDPHAGVGGRWHPLSAAKKLGGRWKAN